MPEQVIVHGLDCGFTGFLPLVGPWQLFGIELNPFAYDLAQTAVWIGQLQWTRANGFHVPQDPVLRPMDKNFRNMDAILVRNPGQPPSEPDWPQTGISKCPKPQPLRREESENTTTSRSRVTRPP